MASTDDTIISISTAQGRRAERIGQNLLDSATHIVPISLDLTVADHGEASLKFFSPTTESSPEDIQTLSQNALLKLAAYRAYEALGRIAFKEQDAVMIYGQTEVPLALVAVDTPPAPVRFDFGAWSPHIKHADPFWNAPDVLLWLPVAAHAEPQAQPGWFLRRPDPVAEVGQKQLFAFATRLWHEYTRQSSSPP